MPNKSRPRTGSLQFYPHVKAKRQTPSFSTVGAGHATASAAKPLNFLAYKAGMTHLLMVNTHPKSHLFNQEEFVPATVLEVPPLTVFGVRAYGKSDRYGIAPLTEVWADKFDKDLSRKMATISAATGKGKGKEKTAKARKTMADLEAIKEKISEVRLLCHSHPGATGGEKKTPDVFEIFISGPSDKQLALAKEKLGQSLVINDVFNEKELVDVRSVSTGKGMQGVIKRHHVKSINRKAKKARAVGSIGPWHPSTVMWTVARPGQMGYNTRTEFNKTILQIASDPKQINPDSGFPHYGLVRGPYILLAGSIPGPVKRAIGLRVAVRPNAALKNRFGAIRHIGTIVEKNKSDDAGVKTVKVKAEEQKKTEHKSVDEEIRSAMSGEKK